MSMILLIGIVVVVILAILLIVVGVKDAKNEGDPLQERLAEYAARGETATLEEIELSQPFIDRVLRRYLEVLENLLADLHLKTLFKLQLNS